MATPDTATGEGGGGSSGPLGDDESAKMFITKRMLEELKRSRGNGTSMITLLLRPKDEVFRSLKMLSEEEGKAAHIKSRVNRQSVESALTSVKERLRLYARVPPNGLALFCGTVCNEETGKERLLLKDFEPPKPVRTATYLCDSSFHTEALEAMLEPDVKFGFIVVDGGGALFGRVGGSCREVLHSFTEDLPKKHSRGGQSAKRFARLRLESRHNFLRKVSEQATKQFLTDNRPNVAGLVLAGSAELKTELQQSDLFDPRLKAVVLKVVDIAYGQQVGFHQAIDLSADVLQNVKLVREQKVIAAFFEIIAKDTGKFCFGPEDTMKALQLGAAQTLIVWDKLDLARCEVKEDGSVVPAVRFVKPGERVAGEVVSSTLLVEWLAENYKRFGTEIQIVTDNSSEGAQFCRGFGVGCLLRYKVDFEPYDHQEADGEAEADLYLEAPS